MDFIAAPFLPGIAVTQKAMVTIAKSISFLGVMAARRSGHKDERWVTARTRVVA